MTEVRPIDANALIARYTEIKGEPGIGLVDALFLDGAMAVVDGAPTLDYAPVRHGEWVWNGFDGAGWECSRCRHEESKEAKKPNACYCPSCGAKMDGGKNDG